MRDNITLIQLGLAYRKAKVDLYYSTDHCLEQIADYEENIYENLKSLQGKINAEDEGWVNSSNFFGSWTLAPKSVDETSQEFDNFENTSELKFSSAQERWQYKFSGANSSNKPIAEFRLMAKCSLDFHVLSALWMLKVGHLFDSKLSDCAFGNRLRRTKNGKDINELSLGSFAPYLKPFRDWRDSGLGAMKDALIDNRKIIAVTADVSSFYHELNSGFMLSPSFVKDVLKLELNEDQQKINRLFINAIQAWVAKTPLKKGLPVGLPASAIIANIALYELDRVFTENLVPIYYGRYVDDIQLVLENKADFKSASEVWEWVFSNSENLLIWSGKNSIDIEFAPRYLDDCESKVQFSKSKTKVFLLSGEAGISMVGSIEQKIHERSSEWRAMPRLPKLAGNVGSDLITAVQGDGEVADSLQKTDGLSLRRADFAMRLRDMEAYERDLNPDSWKEHRHAFLNAFIEHVLVLPHFFELATYLPRVVKLATACEDFGKLKRIIDGLEQLRKTINETCQIKVKSCPDDISELDKEHIQVIWEDAFSIYSSIRAAFPPRLSRTGEQSWNENFSSDKELSIEDLLKKQARLFSYDLAHMPFRFMWLPNEVVSKRGIPEEESVLYCDKVSELLPESILDGQKILSKWLNFEKVPNGNCFSTRPYNLPELSLLSGSKYSDEKQNELRGIILSVRGFMTTESMPHLDECNVLQVSNKTLPMNRRIAVSSWKTDIEDLNKSIARIFDDNAERYARMNRLVDSLISELESCNYLILPELALPARWFIRIALKLNGRGISLIAGIEYLHSEKGNVRNQVWAALSHDGLGFQSFLIYRQDKQRPAIGEEQNLLDRAGLKLVPEETWEKPRIVQHGEFRFAMLVCSELTNISYRACLPGKVDALFLPEWNQDTGTFNALVESAASDIHAYIIQCNDRQYGDSRIRAPFKDNWKRDILRVTGGISDYCVIGQIDVESLRQFQSYHRSPAKPFKPVPDGFEICQSRWMLPK